MNQKNEKTELLSSVPVPKALLALGLPTMIGMMVNALYNLADAYFVAGLGTAQNGAITVAFPLGQIIVGLGLLFGNGAASFISRSLGKGERQLAEQTVSTALYASLFTGAVFILAVFLFLEPILRLLGATDSILPHALVYSRIYVVSSIFNVFTVTMNNIATSEGAAKTTMCALLSGALLNIVLDPLLIYTFEFGISGAAAATAFSQFVSACIYLRYIRSGKSNFRFRPHDFTFSKKIFSEIFKIGVPTLTFQVMTSLATALMTGIARRNGYGDSVIAAVGDVTRIISIGSLMVFGFIKGFQPVAGYSYGAGNVRRLKEAVRTVLIWSTLFCAVFGLSAALLSGPLIAQFTDSDLFLLTFGQKMLTTNGISFVLFGFNTVYSSLFLALGRAKTGFLLGVCRQGICFLPALFLLTAFLSAEALVYAQPAADVLSALVTAVPALRLHVELASLFPTPS